MSERVLLTPARRTPKSTKKLGGLTIMLETLQDMLLTIRAVQARCQLLALCPYLKEFYSPEDVPLIMGILAESVSAGVYDPLFGLELQVKAMISDLAAEATKTCSGVNSPTPVATKGKA